jgi:prevent-host-death family protein
MLQVNIHEAKTNLSKLIPKVVDGEEVIIAKGNKPLVKMTIIDELKPKRKLGTAKGKIKISDDFDEPLEDFKEYMRHVSNFRENLLTLFGAVNRSMKRKT